MKPSYLGDAKDLAKGFMFTWFRKQGLVRGPLVMPFFTCSLADMKGDTIVRTYATILGVTTDAILSHNTWPCSAECRTRYLTGALKQDQLEDTIFLDPDTGIRPTLYSKPRTSKNKYIVTFRDILTTVDCNDDRIAVVYDESYGHADRKNLSQAVDDKLRDLVSSSDRKVSGFAYVGMALNLLFVGNEKAEDRLNAIADKFDRFLDGAEKRIIQLQRVP